MERSRRRSKVAAEAARCAARASADLGGSVVVCVLDPRNPVVRALLERISIGAGHLRENVILVADAHGHSSFTAVADRLLKVDDDVRWAAATSVVTGGDA